MTTATNTYAELVEEMRNAAREADQALGVVDPTNVLHRVCHLEGVVRNLMWIINQTLLTLAAQEHKDKP